MILILLAYAGGVLTIISPCILPVLPFVFARADQSFWRSGLPMLAGMAITFAAVASLAAVGGGWAVEVNQYGRFAAIALLALFGVVLLFPSLSDRLTRPLVALGGRLSQSAEQAGGEAAILPSALLGVATGLLWAPCAGPVLGLILTGAALQGANLQTSLLLVAYALGAATSLAVALLIGGRVFAAMKRSLGVGEWIRRALGVAVLAAVVAIALGLDTGFLTQVSLASTNSVEQGLIDKLHPPGDANRQSVVMAPAAGGAMMSANPAMMAMQAKPGAPPALPIEGNMPPLTGAVQWINSEPLTADALKGKVVLIDFWTYSCINCLRTFPYLRAWYDKYKDKGLVIVGVHAPEFAFEKNIDNVKKAVADFGLTYPVAVDNNYAIWRAFENQYWPADYLIDVDGRIRNHHFGEGGYDETEHAIQQLLAEAGRTNIAKGLVDAAGTGAQAAAELDQVKSPETYLGFMRAENFASPGGSRNDKPFRYEPGTPQLNQWSLSGTWTIGWERAVLDEADGAVLYRFHARDLHLVLGPAKGGGQVRFRVTIDGKPPGASHGADTDADGNGVVTEQRLYQLVRQDGTIADHTFEIRFLDPGAEAYAFTFG